MAIVSTLTCVRNVRLAPTRRCLGLGLGLCEASTGQAMMHWFKGEYQPNSRLCLPWFREGRGHWFMSSAVCGSLVAGSGLHIRQFSYGRRSHHNEWFTQWTAGSGHAGVVGNVAVFWYSVANVYRRHYSLVHTFVRPAEILAEVPEAFERPHFPEDRVSAAPCHHAPHHDLHPHPRVTKLGCRLQSQKVHPALYPLP